MGIAACGSPWLRFVAGVRLFAGSSLRKRDSLKEGIESCLHCSPPLLEQQLLVVSSIGPFVVRVHLLQVVKCLIQHPRKHCRIDNVICFIGGTIGCCQPPPPTPTDTAADPICRAPPSTAPRQSIPAESTSSSSSSSRPTFLANSRHSFESLSDRSKPPKSTARSGQSFFHGPPMQDPSPPSRHRGHAKGHHGWCSSVGLPMLSQHTLLKFHVRLLGSLSGLLKLVQGHITLHTKGMPRLLKVMCLEHLDNSLIHRLQQRRGVRWQEDKLDVLMQVLQHLVVRWERCRRALGYRRGGPKTCNTPSARASVASYCRPGKCGLSSNHWSWQTSGQAGWPCRSS